MDAARAVYTTVCSSFSVPKPEQHLNPICALFWLAMLEWEKDGVKIGVINHRVKYYPPGEDQAKKRRADGVGRGDLGYFLPALEKVKKFWGSDRNSNIIEVARRASLMLGRLGIPYGTDYSTLSCLENYRKILQDILDGKGGGALEPKERAEKQFCADTLEEARGLLAKMSTKALETLIIDNQEKYLTFLEEQQAPPPRMTSSYPPRSFPVPIPQAAPVGTSSTGSVNSSSPHSSVSSSDDALSDIAYRLHPGTSPPRADRLWPERDADGDVVRYHGHPPGDDAEF